MTKRQIATAIRDRLEAQGRLTPAADALAVELLDALAEARALRRIARQAGYSGTGSQGQPVEHHALRAADRASLRAVKLAEALALDPASIPVPEGADEDGQFAELDPPTGRDKTGRV